jgi:hypothetical protein
MALSTSTCQPRLLPRTSSAQTPWQLAPERQQGLGHVADRNRGSTVDVSQIVDRILEALTVHTYVENKVMRPRVP